MFGPNRTHFGLKDKSPEKAVCLDLEHWLDQESLLGFLYMVVWLHLKSGYSCIVRMHSSR